MRDEAVAQPWRSPCLNPHSVCLHVSLIICRCLCFYFLSLSLALLFSQHLILDPAWSISAGLFLLCPHLSVHKARVQHKRNTKRYILFNYFERSHVLQPDTSNTEIQWTLGPLIKTSVLLYPQFWLVGRCWLISYISSVDMVLDYLYIYCNIQNGKRIYECYQRWKVWQEWHLLMFE